MRDRAVCGPHFPGARIGSFGDTQTKRSHEPRKGTRLMYDVWGATSRRLDKYEMDQGWNRLTLSVSP